jgi:hypothetical protein
VSACTGFGGARADRRERTFFEVEDGGHPGSRTLPASDNVGRSGHRSGWPFCGP